MVPGNAEGLELGPCSMRAVREAREVIDDAGVERTEEGEHLFPNAYAKVTAVDVGRVDCVAEVAFPGVGFDVGTGRSDERTEKVIGRGREHRKPLHRGTAKDANEDGLGAVLELMPGCEERRIVSRRERP